MLFKHWLIGYLAFGITATIIITYNVFKSR